MAPMDTNISNSADLSKKDFLHSKVLNKKIKLHLVCVEDGLDNIGFRKFSGYVKSIHPETNITYIPVGNHRSVFRVLFEKQTKGLNNNDLSLVAKFLSDNDVIGFSSMTSYSYIVHNIIAEIRKLQGCALPWNLLYGHGHYIFITIYCNL